MPCLLAFGGSAPHLGHPAAAHSLHAARVSSLAWHEENVWCCQICLPTSAFVGASLLCVCVCVCVCAVLGKGGRASSPGRSFSAAWQSARVWRRQPLFAHASAVKAGSSPHLAGARPLQACYPSQQPHRARCQSLAQAHRGRQSGAVLHTKQVGIRATGRRPEAEGSAQVRFKALRRASCRARRRRLQCWLPKLLHVHVDCLLRLRSALSLAASFCHRRAAGH